MRTEHLTTVYVVRWPDGVTKVGRTGDPRRVRKFETRGARIDRLIHRTTAYTETALQARLIYYGPASFARWQDSVAYLGAGGCGFTECRTLDDESYLRFLGEVDSRG